MNNADFRIGIGTPFVPPAQVTSLGNAAVAPWLTSHPPAAMHTVTSPGTYHAYPQPGPAVFGPGQLQAYTLLAARVPRHFADDGSSLAYGYPSFLALVCGYSSCGQLRPLVEGAWFAQKFIALADTVTLQNFQQFADSPGVVSAYIVWLNHLSKQLGQVESLMYEKQWAGPLFLHASQLFGLSPKGVNILAAQPAFPAVFNALCVISQSVPALQTLVTSQPMLMAAAYRAINAHLRGIQTGLLMQPLAAQSAPAVGGASANLMAIRTAPTTPPARPSTFESPVRPRPDALAADILVSASPLRTTDRARKRRNRAARATNL